MTVAMFPLIDVTVPVMKSLPVCDLHQPRVFPAGLIQLCAVALFPRVLVLPWLTELPCVTVLVWTELFPRAFADEDACGFPCPLP